MTVPLNDRFAGPYETTGGETVLAYDFKIISSGDIAVFRRREGVSAQLVLGTDYSVDGVGAANGGNVTLVDAADAGDVYTVEGASPLSRVTDFAGQQAYKSDAINAEFDRLQRQLVELETRLDRALTSSRYVAPGAPLELPEFDGSPRVLVYKDGKLDQEVYEAIGEGPAPWASPVPYAIGLVCVVGPPATLVTYNGEGYVCTVAHTASLAAPDPAKFEQVANGSLSGPGTTVVNRVGVFADTSGAALAQTPVAIDSSTGDTTGVRDLAASGKRIGTGRIAATIAADTNDWAPTGFGNAELIDVTYSSNGLKLTGIAGGASGRVIGLRNASAANAGVLVDSSASSSAANRLGIPNGLRHDAGDVIWLRHNGTEWKLDGPKSKPDNVIVFTGSGTWTKPTGLVAVEVEVQAGGGGGGSAHTTTATHSAAGSGGGGGGYAKKRIAAASLSATETVTVGAAGAGGASGASNSGSSGGNSSSGAHVTCNGGTGGTTVASGTAIAAAAAGSGGTASGGDINIPGQDGARGYRATAAASNTLGGAGGSSRLGLGGATVGPNATAHGDVSAAKGYGGGGGGAVQILQTASTAGADGKIGIVIVREIFQ